MAIKRIECPECGAGLKSSTGFTAGQSVACPKCETYFAVELPEEEENDEEEARPAKKKPLKVAASRGSDEDDDDKPKKKKKKKRSDDDDDEEKSYKNSPMRFAVLGILVVVMVVLGVLLVLKMKKEKEEAKAGDTPPPSGGAAPPPPPGGGAPPPLGGVGVGGIPKGGGFVPKGGGFVPKGGGFVPKGGGGFPQVGNAPAGGDGILAETPRPGSPENIQLMDKLSKKLIGTWEGRTGPDGSVHKLTYQASGQFTLDVGGKSTSGNWQAVGLVGGKVLKINRGGVALKVSFEGDELLHDTTTPGESIVMRKK